ncbi:indolepyruvate oxidoreductase subunit beta [Chloroflexota bacterium]
MVKEFNIIIAGVGGQGVILMSELLGNAAVKDGLNVRGSEVLGMAARGGSVSSTIRLGNGVVAPLVPTGKCDVLVGMEPAEALRNISYLSPSSLVILNTEVIVPFTVAIGESEYPGLETVIKKLTGASNRVITLNANEVAEKAGSLQAANTVMLGALFGTGQLPIKLETVKTEIQVRFSARLAQVNMTALDLGYQTCRQAVK